MYTYIHTYMCVCVCVCVCFFVCVSIYTHTFKNLKKKPRDVDVADLSVARKRCKSATPRQQRFTERFSCCSEL
jgi:hypothetical protein